MFEALGRFAYRFRWFVVAFWVIVFGVSVAATPLLESVLTGGFSDPNTPGEQAGAHNHEKLGKGTTPQHMQV
jgi:uncharacterized membrane protein YdfJ with MMPL/SSD domain